MVAKSLNEAQSQNKQTAFLCHSHQDRDLAQGLQVILKENGWDLYIDWQDNEMPESPNKETANKIKSRIISTNWFIFLATERSVQSRWCPWEIGYADSEKPHSRILIIPTKNDNNQWFGNEYLQLYKKIDKGFEGQRSGYAMYKAGANTDGIWVDQIR